MDDRKVQSLSFFRFEVFKALVLYCAMTQLGESHELDPLLFTIVTDLDQVFGALSLAFDSLEYALLVPLQNVKACLQRL